jgi:hypothetical protein
MGIKRRLALMVLIMASATPVGIGAQGFTTRRQSRVPATVVFVDSLPVSGVPFVVNRRPDLSPADLIVLRSSATPAEFSDAVRSLLTARQAGGDLPIGAAIVRMRPHQRLQGTRPPFPWTARVLADLRGATPRAIPGLGIVRAVDIWLPRQARARGQLGPARPQ